jgi:hypothetical protein
VPRPAPSPVTLAGPPTPRQSVGHLLLESLQKSLNKNHVVKFAIVSVVLSSVLIFHFLFFEIENSKTLFSISHY